MGITAYPVGQSTESSEFRQGRGRAASNQFGKTGFTRSPPYLHTLHSFRMLGDSTPLKSTN